MPPTVVTAQDLCHFGHHNRFFHLLTYLLTYFVLGFLPRFEFSHPFRTVRSDAMQASNRTHEMGVAKTDHRDSFLSATLTYRLSFLNAGRSQIEINCRHVSAVAS